VGDRAGAGRTTCEGLGDRAVEFGGTDLTKELGQPDGVAADVLAAERERVE